MFKDLWQLCCRVAIVAGVALSLFAVLELLRGFAFFYHFSPTAGWIYAGLLVGGTVAALLYWAALLRAYPKVITPPPMPERDQASHAELRRYVRYLARYLGRLARNPHLTADESERARTKIRELEEMLGAHPLNDDLRRAIETTESETLGPLLTGLEEQASWEVRRSVRDVMLGVSLSPYHSVDLLVVVYRNSAMILRIAGLYCSRPNTPEQLKILRDVLRVVVTINFLYIGRNLLENLFANIPLIGRVVDDIGQGLGAGLFTSATGHAAIERCAAYRGWSKKEAADTLASQTRAFLGDVRDIFTRDVLPKLKGRIVSELPVEKTDEPGFWDKLTGGINTAVEITGQMVGNLVIKPVVAGTRGMARVGSYLAESARPAGVSNSHGRRHRHRRREPALFRILGTFSQRVIYTLRGPPRP